MNLYSVWDGGKQVGETKPTADEALSAYRNGHTAGATKPVAMGDEDRLRRAKIRMLPDTF